MARCYSRAVGRRDFSAVLARRRAIRRARRPLAAGALDLVHRAVGPLEQVVGPRVRVVRHSAARAGADDDRRAVGEHDRLLDRARDPAHEVLMRSSSARSSRTTTNSSPPSRATVSLPRTTDASRAAVATSTSSPAWWPWTSLTAF